LQSFVICDFDGTITLKDSTDLLLHRFADPTWLNIEKEWLEGKIGSRECLERQLRLVRADKEDLSSLLEEIPLDPAFPLFASYCREENIPVAIASDSFDLLVTPFLQRYHLDWIPAYTNRLRISGKRLFPTFPYEDPQCRNANCKCALLRLLGKDADASVLIGDGPSDVCSATRVSTVFARKSSEGWPAGLLEFCRRNSIKCHAFASFQDVLNVIKSPKNP
jgi:2-hydroxy-3-keto-5-methylthiopentenyl-1-phosphate phosphatase